jgi:hypothetical protein
MSVGDAHNVEMSLLLLRMLLQSMLRNLTLGSTALAAAQAGSNVPREACLFVSIAPDGKVRLSLSALHQGMS